MGIIYNFWPNMGIIILPPHRAVVRLMERMYTKCLVHYLSIPGGYYYDDPSVS